jgi:hypothetical protein
MVNCTVATYLHSDTSTTLTPMVLFGRLSVTSRKITIYCNKTAPVESLQRPCNRGKTLR